jgi:hypothetical protein
VGLSGEGGVAEVFVGDAEVGGDEAVKPVAGGRLGDIFTK